MAPTVEDIATHRRDRPTHSQEGSPHSLTGGIAPLTHIHRRDRSIIMPTTRRRRLLPLLLLLLLLLLSSPPAAADETPTTLHFCHSRGDSFDYHLDASRGSHDCSMLGASVLHDEFQHGKLILGDLHSVQPVRLELRDLHGGVVSVACGVDPFSLRDHCRRTRGDVLSFFPEGETSALKRRRASFRAPHDGGTMHGGATHSDGGGRGDEGVEAADVADEGAGGASAVGASSEASAGTGDDVSEETEAAGTLLPSSRSSALSVLSPPEIDAFDVLPLSLSATALHTLFYQTEDVPASSLLFFSSIGSEPAVPQLWPILMARTTPTKYFSKIVQFTLSFRQFAVRVVPLAKHYTSTWLHRRTGTKGTIARELVYGHQMHVYANLSFAITAARAGRYGDRMDDAASELWVAIRKMLLKIRYCNPSRTPPARRYNASELATATSHETADQTFEESNGGGEEKEKEDAAMRWPLDDFSRKHEGVKLASVLWTKDPLTGITRFFDRQVRLLTLYSLPPR